MCIYTAKYGLIKLCDNGPLSCSEAKKKLGLRRTMSRDSYPWALATLSADKRYSRVRIQLSTKAQVALS